MRHCRSCEHCILDLKALLASNVIVDKCDVMEHNIFHPTISGLRCRAYQRRGGAKDAEAKRFSGKD